jgi:biopolymer transport protein ExbD
MRMRSRQTFRSETDMTPILDMTFQLTFFFMLTLNFSSDIQSDLVRLPASEIAMPAEGVLEASITVQTLASGLVLFGGDQMAVGALRGPLQRERTMIRSVLHRRVKDVTVIMRADRDVPAGKVQEVLRICQELGFERFVLRARRGAG